MFFFSRFTTQALLSLLFFLNSNAAWASDWTDGFSLEKKTGDQNFLTFSPYTRHFSPSPEHEHVWLVGVERERNIGSVAGVALFTNSFGQPSMYYYPWGVSYRNLFGEPQLYAKITGGLLYGYKGRYEDKVPLNYNGFSPGIVPALGWDLGDGFGVQVNLLGFNALMLQLALPLK